MSYGGAQAMYERMKAQQAAAAAAANAGSSLAAASAPSTSGPPPLDLKLRSVVPPKDPVVILFGSTNYVEMGKKPGLQDVKVTPNLTGPHRLLSGFGAVRVTFLATGGMSAHVLALGAGGEAFSWGRNDTGQLGHGDTTTRYAPARVTLLQGQKIVKASTGKAHSVFLDADGTLLACGSCKQGAVGNGVKKMEQQPKPTALVPPSGTTFTHVASGASFNLAIDGEGDVWSWGWSEFGVLGHNSDGEWNTKEGSVKLSYSAEPAPQRIAALGGKGCIDVACGQAHCAAVAKDGIVYTWGNGGYGRLGHKDQQDKWVPTPLLEVVRAREVSCGAAHTAAVGWSRLANGSVCSAAAPSLFMWGKVKGASQNAWMYPMAEEDLRGWSLKHFACGNTHNVAAADSSVISWGSACLSGELGFGEGGKKSSARPDKVSALEGAAVAQIACGVANSLLLVERSAAVDALPEWAPLAALEEAADEDDDDEAAAPKAKGKAAAGKGKRVAAEAEPKPKKSKK